ncbi:hypothetical protein L207DRAFT_227982 [Hyaloscypha variabilis F]|uniref:Uncharacterized protein n=1 Tax=Hyaloscypha variabilis (strain UAMH 11265 / GT02V1 / F) TaxID=1149755 RepID=A0A2J6QV99_HYAVF|nr:hypothetical protein L207DRAFT_227982 [Hyaloscypha variabilis F]
MKSRQQYDISLRPYSAQRPPHLELSSLDRMHTGTMFPAAMQLIITDPITAIVVYGGWADQMHTNSDADPREIPQICDNRTLLLGQDPTCAGGPISLPLQPVKCAHAPAVVAPCADSGSHGITLSYMYFHHWSSFESRNPLPGQLESTSLFWAVGRGGWKQQRNFRASIQEPYHSTSAATVPLSTLPVSFLQPVASQFNAKSSESRKIAWRMYPTTTTHHVAFQTPLQQPVRTRENAKYIFIIQEFGLAVPQMLSMRERFASGGRL